MTSRLNARIDEELARKIEHLKARTDLSVTEIVRASIEHYYDQFLRKETGEAARLLERTGFVGCIEGKADLSETYRDGLARSLEDKLGS